MPKLNGKAGWKPSSITKELPTNLGKCLLTLTVSTLRMLQNPESRKSEKAPPNGSNMLMQHSPTLLNLTCCTRLPTMLPDVEWSLILSDIVFDVAQHFFCSEVWQQCCIRLTTVFSVVQHCWTCACPLSWLCGYLYFSVYIWFARCRVSVLGYSMTEKQHFQSLDVESLNTSDIFSNRRGRAK